jgi:hypothetical protein
VKSPYRLRHARQLHGVPRAGAAHLLQSPTPMVQRLNDITPSAIYPRPSMLFMEGQQGRGHLCSVLVLLGYQPARGRFRLGIRAGLFLVHRAYAQAENFVPLDAARVRRIVSMLEPFSFTKLYGA